MWAIFIIVCDRGGIFNRASFERHVVLGNTFTVSFRWSGSVVVCYRQGNSQRAERQALAFTWTNRSVGVLPQIATLACPVVRPGGAFIMNAEGDWDDECHVYVSPRPKAGGGGLEASGSPFPSSSPAATVGTVSSTASGRRGAKTAAKKEVIAMASSGSAMVARALVRRRNAAAPVRFLSVVLGSLAFGFRRPSCWQMTGHRRA